MSNFCSEVRVQKVIGRCVIYREFGSFFQMYQNKEERVCYMEIDSEDSQIVEALGMEYVDLYLVYYPERMKGKRSLEFSGEDLIPFDMKGTWEAMEESHRLGLAKAIGVSYSLAKSLASSLLMQTSHRL